MANVTPWQQASLAKSGQAVYATVESASLAVNRCMTAIAVHSAAAVVRAAFQQSGAAAVDSIGGDVFGDSGPASALSPAAAALTF